MRRGVYIKMPKINRNEHYIEVLPNIKITFQIA